MARGGPRSGKPGAQYSNRSDLQSAPRLAATAQTGQPCGVAAHQLASQPQMPMAPSPTPPTPLPAPSTRPNEPVQSGLPSGPGPGPQSVPGSIPDPVEAQLRGLYYAFPNRDLASLLEMIDRGQTF